VQDAYCSGYASFNGFYGHGMVNALAAVASGTAPSPTANAPVTDAPATTGSSQGPTGPAKSSRQPVGPEQLAAGQ
jgi:hypothetical protein